ncbi:TIGR04283 family arsenosugar biosynthesis glycosyltransferase [Desulfonatronum thioautotrophicum]|uniref:TIGR04283 family arsenosugar biosynthesis glycosyltransferase n=1 Tax=Desulfonatronum thioautotrophicum TaxID=617001 RepID=UPI000A036557|nr:TIGR04283 family arsenosugar biosynthesis glycosyltransferase [Desulfonatronum thioautotrophicum]
MDESTTVPNSARVLVFTRYPVPGQVKTRLIPALGPDTAARLHRRMTEHVVTSARELIGSNRFTVHVGFTGAPLKAFRSWLGHDLGYVPQTGDDLGRRMGHGIAAVLRAGPGGRGPVVVIGSDVPGLDRDILGQALDALQRSDLVIGPAEDGGYYLIGMHRPHPELFENMDWGSSSVFAQTMDVAKRLGLTVTVLPVLRDVDRPEDLDVLRHDPRFADVFTGQNKLSVIIPCLNEARNLPRTLEHVFQSADQEEELDVIVVDGGSRDATSEIAARYGALVLQSHDGRAAQQNVGAARALGRMLLFLHADTLPPKGFDRLIRQALDDPAVVAGAFRLRTDSPGPAMRLIEGMANLRSAAWQYPYGDQGLFMEKRVFQELGGFSALPIMEDFELVRRLRRRGRIVTLPDSVLTSSRRWRRLGLLRTTLVNQLMVLGFVCGVPVHALARFYRGGKGG